MSIINQQKNSNKEQECIASHVVKGIYRYHSPSTSHQEQPYQPRIVVVTNKRPKYKEVFTTLEDFEESPYSNMLLSRSRGDQVVVQGSVLLFKPVIILTVNPKEFNACKIINKSHKEDLPRQLVAKYTQYLDAGFSPSIAEEKTAIFFKEINDQSQNFQYPKSINPSPIRNTSVQTLLSEELQKLNSSKRLTNPKTSNTLKLDKPVIDLDKFIPKDEFVNSIKNKKL